MIEEAIQKKMSSAIGEKTFLDKLLGRQDSEKIRQLMKKERLNRTDMLELLYLISGTEQKLYNYDAYDRYYMSKYFVWIREFVSIMEQMFDEEEIYKGKLDERSQELFDKNRKLMEHNIKFLVDLYFHLARSTLSINASGFIEILKNKFEISYPEQKGLYTQPEQRSFFGLGKGGNK